MFMSADVYIASIQLAQKGEQGQAKTNVLVHYGTQQEVKTGY